MTTGTAASLTRAASKQTYYTIRLLVDRERVEDAYRAYGYFRWVDDRLDADSCPVSERQDFLRRQEDLLEGCLQGAAPQAAFPQERMLVELMQGDPDPDSGLKLYLKNMMQVMHFDAGRRGRWVSQAELDDYTRWLATAVTECIHHFVGHDDATPHDATRYLAVSGAHIAHMLRDTFDDTKLGYYNIPSERLQADRLQPDDVQADAYRDWVQERVGLARRYFRAGKAYFARVQNPRCRLACFAYIARFEWVLDTIEREGYRLRPQYEERKSPRSALQMAWLTLSFLARSRGPALPLRAPAAHPEDLSQGSAALPRGSSSVLRNR
jgi:phytoene/squalene synthetase